MAQEIGVAYVSLLPSGRGFSKATQTEAEKGFKGAEKTSNSFFSGITKWAKRGAIAIGGMVTGVAALAAGGGIARALNIEDAQAKLKGLGHDTKAIEAIMTNALAAVKGTAFGLDAAATVAASAVASGIKPGKELERYLRLTADAATIAGTSLDEMGSILNKVTAKGVAQMDDLNRLTERGIPILQWLAKEYGVTADELSDMVSRGEVDAATFRKAIENNISGAALESGNTTRGAFANMMAALSRLGLAFVGDGLTGAKAFFNEVTIILDGLESRLGPWVDTLQSKLSGFGKIEGFGESFLAGFDRLVATLKNLDATPLGMLLSLLTPLLPVMREVGATVGPVLAETFQEIADVLEPMIPLLAESLVDAIVELAPPFADLLVAILPMLPPLIELTIAILPLLIELLKLLIPPLVDFMDNLTEVANAFSGAMDVLGGDMTLEQLGMSVINAGGIVGEFGTTVANVFAAVSTALSQLGATWNLIWSTIAMFFAAVGTRIETTARDIWNKVPEEFKRGVDRAVNWVKSLPARIGEFFRGAGNWLVQSGKDLINGFIRGIKEMMGPVGAAIDGVLSFASGFFPHSPALRGTFSGSGWTAVREGGEALLEQFNVGIQAKLPDIGFAPFAASLRGSSVPIDAAGLMDGVGIRGTLDLGNGLTGFVRGELVKVFPSSGSLRSQLP